MICYLGFPWQQLHVSELESIIIGRHTKMTFCTPNDRSTHYLTINSVVIEGGIHLSNSGSKYQILGLPVPAPMNASIHLVWGMFVQSEQR